MSKVTKWAVETAKADMDEAIHTKLSRWDKKHPAQTKELTVLALAEIAVKDPVWQRQVVARVRSGYGDIDLRRSDFERYSPMAAAAIAKNAAVDATRNRMREEITNDLCERRDQIIRAAIIGDCDSADLLKQVNEFCKYPNGKQNGEIRL